MTDSVIADDRPNGRLEARADGELLGHIQYFVLDEPAPALVPVHTVVEPAHEGKGVAGSLARELYAIAAREGFAVAPLCPYVVRWAAKQELQRRSLAPSRAARSMRDPHPTR